MATQSTAVSSGVGPELEVIEGPARGARVRIGYSPFVFGRAERNAGTLGDDPELSRRHASASLLDPSRLLVEDLGSTNGTFVNDLRIGVPTVVGPGDLVSVGATSLRVVEPGRPMSAAPEDAPAGSGARP